MRVALVNPRWSFAGSIYFGCREPHLPIELGAAALELRRAGHEPTIIDAHLEDLDPEAVRARLEALGPQMTVITTAPTYLFWRCPPPELTVPRRLARAVREVAGTLVAVGPHGSTTPRAALRKLGVDVVVIGECEEVLVRLASSAPWTDVPSIAYVGDAGDQQDSIIVHEEPAATRFEALPPLRWDDRLIARHAHHHHRFEIAPPFDGPGAEVEWTRGCPYHCTFCNKELFRDRFRRRPVEVVLDEIDALARQGVTYVYFIDEIFLPDVELLEALARRPMKFGVQLRVDSWTPELLDLLGAAGCVSIEAGVESITPAGRSLLAKRCRASTEELTALLVRARRSVGFVQANLIAAGTDETDAVEAWREELGRHGVWANRPVPMFPYPGSPDYRLRWGAPDDHAWERAHARYLDETTSFSDIQDARPRSLAALEEEAA